MRRLSRLVVPACGWRMCASQAKTVAMEMPEGDKKLEEFAKMYSQLTLKEVTQLQKLIFKNLGHSDDFYEQALLRGLGGGGGGGGVVMAAAPAAAAATGPSEDEIAAKAAAEEAEKKKAAAKSSFDVKLGKYPAENKIKLIKELRAVTSLPLKEAKDLIDKSPGFVAKNLGKEDAEKLQKLMKDLGAEIDLL